MPAGEPAQILLCQVVFKRQCSEGIGGGVNFFVSQVGVKESKLFPDVDMAHQLLFPACIPTDLRLQFFTIFEMFRINNDELSFACCVFFRRHHPGAVGRIGELLFKGLGRIAGNRDHAREGAVIVHNGTDSDLPAGA